MQATIRLPIFHRWTSPERRALSAAKSIWALMSPKRPSMKASLQSSTDEEFLRQSVVLYAQHIWLAACLAVLDIALPLACGFVDRSQVPHATARTLKSCFHNRTLPPEPNRLIEGLASLPIMSRLLFTTLEAS